MPLSNSLSDISQVKKKKKMKTTLPLSLSHTQPLNTYKQNSQQLIIMPSSKEPCAIELLIKVSGNLKWVVDEIINTNQLRAYLPAIEARAVVTSILGLIWEYERIAIIPDYKVANPNCTLCMLWTWTFHLVESRTGYWGLWCVDNVEFFCLTVHSTINYLSTLPSPPRSWPV